MYTTEVTYKYGFLTKDPSWELCEKIKGFLKTEKCSVSSRNVEAFSGSIQITSVNSGVPESTLFRIESNIPKWVEEIKKNEKSEEEENYAFVGKWLKNTKHNTPKKPSSAAFDHLKLFRGVIHDLREDLEDEYKEGTGNFCLAADIEDLIEIYNTIKRGKYAEALKLRRELDTAAREYIPDEVVDFLDRKTV